MKITAPITLLGGTFDPIHNGHLAIAHAVQEKLQLQEIRFIPCFQSPHRNEPQASPADRLAMVKLAIKNEKKFIADDREIRRQGLSYMIDTLQSLRVEFPQTPLYLILSTDAFANFQHWQRWQEIPQYAHLIITQRPGYVLSENIPELQKLLTKHQIQDITKLQQKLSGYIFLLDFVGPDIAATEIRKQIALGLAPRDLLPQDVWEYIQKHKLYLG